MMRMQMMRKLTVVAVLLVQFFGQAFSQNNDFEKQLYVGFGGGAQLSSVDFVPSVLQKNNIGIHGGISAKYIAEKHLGLLLELNYAQRGWTEDFEDRTDLAYARTLNYLEMPFMTHVYFGNKVRFVFNAGPQIAFLLGSSATMSDALKKEIDELKETSTTKVGVQYESDLRRFDYGLTGGAGIEFKSGAGNFQLEGRYYFGLGDIFENRKSRKEKFYFNRSAHRIIEAKLSYYFRIK